MWVLCGLTSFFIRWEACILVVYSIARLVVKNGHQKDTCYIAIGLRAQNVDTILSSIINTIGRANVFRWRKKGKSYVWTLLIFRSQHLIIKRDMTMFVIRWFPIRSKCQKCMWSLNCPQTGSRALYSLHCGEASHSYRKFSDSIAHLLSVDPTITPAILEKAMLQKF